MQPELSRIENFYEFYKLIYTSPFDRGKKRMVMTSALGYESWSWRVVGISRDAIFEIKNNNFKHPAKKLSRDHKIPRSKFIDSLFDENLQPLDIWWSKIWENDQTELITNIEHKSGVRSKIFSIDPSLCLFQSEGIAGWKHTKKKEGEFIRHLIIKNGF